MERTSPEDLALLAAVADGDTGAADGFDDERVDRLIEWGWLMRHRSGHLELTGAGWAQLGRASRNMVPD